MMTLPTPTVPCLKMGNLNQEFMQQAWLTHHRIIVILLIIFFCTICRYTLKPETSESPKDIFAYFTGISRNVFCDILKFLGMRPVKHVF